MPLSKRFEVRNIAIVFLLWMPVLYAGSIQGWIYNEKHKPLNDVYVSIESLDKITVSAENGYFKLSPVPPGSYRLTFNHIAYETLHIDEVQVAGQPTRLDTVLLTSRIMQTGPTVVTATRSPNRVFEVPAAINSVSPMQIRYRQSKTSAEALREETGVFVQKTNHGGGSAIVRGLSSNRILLMVDGIRLNNSTYRLGNHQYLTTVDHNIVENIEVLRGPGSVLYGSDAMGGTINLITRDPSFSADGWRWRGNTFSRYASADREKTLRAAYTLRGRNVALRMGLSYKNFDDLRRGANSEHAALEQSTDGLLQSPSGFEVLDMEGKALTQLGGDQLLTFAYQSTQQNDVPRYDKYENDGYHKWYYDPQIRRLGYALYEKQELVPYVRNLQLRLSYHYQKEGRRYQKSDDQPQTNEWHTVGTSGLGLQAQTIMAYHTLTYGLDFYADDVQSARYSISPDTDQRVYDPQARYPDGAQYHSLGLFIRDEWQLGPRWKINPGLRYSRMSTRFTLAADTTLTLPFDPKVDQNYDALTTNLAVMHRLSTNWRLYGNVAQAFRAPNLSDLAKFGESKGAIYEIPNPAVEPEKMLNVDLGLKYRNTDWRLDGSVYYTRIYDVLASADAKTNGSTAIIGGTEYKLKSKQNIGEAFITGLELSLSRQFHCHYRLEGQLTYTYGHNTTFDEPVGGIPPLFGLIALHRSFGQDLRATVFSRFAARQDRLSADDKDDPRIPEGGTPAWYTINTRIRWQAHRRIGLQFALENLLDYNYREHGSGINGPGRNFVMSLRLQL